MVPWDLVIHPFAKGFYTEPRKTNGLVPLNPSFSGATNRCPPRIPPGDVESTVKASYLGCRWKNSRGAIKGLCCRNAQETIKKIQDLETVKGLLGHCRENE